MSAQGACLSAVACRPHADFDQPHNVELGLNYGDGGGYIAFLNVLLFNDTTVLVHPAP